MATAVLITLVGMGLVFGAILLFWLFMAMLARYAGDRAGGEEPVHVETPDAGLNREMALRQQAALAAVSVALALRSEEAHRPFPLPPTALVSTWQAVMRAQLLGQGGRAR
jgi:Na+-transporting methylmalonyl-CoA/oxaloacetate decarboxylase gamma subunit